MFAQSYRAARRDQSVRQLARAAIARNNYLFGGSDRGGERAATMSSLIESAKLNGIDPEAYLRDAVARIADRCLMLKMRRSSQIRAENRSIAFQSILQIRDL